MILHFLSNNFRWRIVAVSVFVCATLFFSGSARAASFVFPSRTFSVSAGQTFSVPIVVNPEGEKQYTVRFIAEFPADKLEVTSFAFTPVWLPLSQSGYDAIDKVHGLLVKTAGFPKGFAARETFGTITFRAKKSGEAVMTVGSSSFILNADSTSTLRSRPQLRVSIIPGDPSSAPVEISTSTTVESTATRLLESLPDLPMGEENLFDVISAPEVQSFGRSNVFFVLLVGAGIVMALVLIYGVARYRRRRFIQRLKRERL